MNPSFRKVALIAAALGLLVSLYFALSPNDDEEAASTTTAAQTTTPATTAEQEETTTEATTTAPAEAELVRVRITIGDSVPALKKFSVRRGREVEIVIDSQLADEVHVHGYDVSADVAPGAPATIRFTATAPGRFEIELEERRLPIAELEVRP